MDIKHVLNARAILTLGKDMTFRDYSQGAFRMRGIGVGQTIHLYVIPEVERLMVRELAETGEKNNAYGKLTINQKQQNIIKGRTYTTNKSNVTPFTHRFRTGRELPPQQKPGIGKR